MIPRRLPRKHRHTASHRPKMAVERYHLQQKSVPQQLLLLRNTFLYDVIPASV